MMNNLAMSATRITVLVVIAVLWLLFVTGWFRRLTGWPHEDDLDELKALWRIFCGNRVVVGVDSLSQLQEIIAHGPAPAVTPPAELSSEELDLINPSRWNTR